MIRPDPDTRAAWADLAERYRFLYGMNLQARIAEMRFDVADWYWIGGKLEVPSPTPPRRPARRQRDPNAEPHTPVWPPRGSRRLEPETTAASVTEPAGGIESPSLNPGSLLSGRPDAVKAVIMQVSVQTGVSIPLIMGGRRRWAEVQARHLCVRRLAALPWCGSHPTHQQIAQWMGLERTTVLHALGKSG